MDNTRLQALITDAMPDAVVTVDGDGQHFHAVIVSEQFTNQSRVQRQQIVYQALGDSFQSGAMHALNMKTYTPDEWQQQQAN